MDQRHETLRLLGIFHLVYAGLVVVGSLMPLIWLALASLWWPQLAGEVDPTRDLPVQVTGTLAAALVGVGVILAWIWAGVLIVAARSLMTARRYVFCQVVAAVACLNMPLGMVLGAVTLVMLTRTGTRDVFVS